MKSILEIEKQGWRALSSEGSAATDFYQTVLSKDAIMLFPGGLRLEGKESVLASLAAQPWKSFQLEEPRVVRVAEGVEVLTYKVSAQREGSPPYEALVSSTYTQLDGSWRLAVHQHTPITRPS